MRHPSTFRTEASVWTTTVAIGLLIGAWNAFLTPTPAVDVARSVQLSTVSTSIDTPPADQEEAASVDARSVTLQIGVWVLNKILAFARGAWWLLPIPVLFSLWRQFRTVPECAHCGSRRLAPIV